MPEWRATRGGEEQVNGPAAICTAEARVKRYRYAIASSTPKSVFWIAMLAQAYKESLWR